MRIKKNPARLTAAVVAGLLGTFMAAESHAATIPFTWALNYSYNPDATGQGTSNPQTDYVQVQNSAPATAASSGYSKSGAWGSVDSFASADLATGQLKIHSAVTADMNGGAYPYVQTNAIFGDSFSTTGANGTPFVWNNSTATFNIDFTGVNSIASSDGFANSSAFVFLALLDKGTLDPAKPFIGTANTIQYFLWDIGNPNQQIYYTDPQGHTTALDITAGYTDVPSSISAIVNPHSDFDWVLLLGASGQVSPGDSFDFDLSHTLTLSYTGPDGAITTSESGQFANISQTGVTAVTEPGTLALLGLSLAGIGMMRRRKAV